MLNKILPIIIYLITGILYDIFIMIPIIKNTNQKAINNNFADMFTFSNIIFFVLVTPIIYPCITIYALGIIIKRVFKLISSTFKQSKLYISICDYFYIRY